MCPAWGIESRSRYYKKALLQCLFVFKHGVYRTGAHDPLVAGSSLGHEKLMFL